MIRFLNSHANTSVLSVAIFFAVLQVVWWPLTCRARVLTAQAFTWWHEAQ